MSSVALGVAVLLISRVVDCLQTKFNHILFSRYRTGCVCQVNLPK